VQAMVWTSREGWAKAQLQTRDLIDVAWATN